MGGPVKYVISFIHLLLLSSGIVCVPIQSSQQNFRVKREDGYVYDKPNISFDLPTRPTSVSTQAPTVDRTQEQQMYYAYPAPAGDTVNIGYSTTGSTTTTSTTSSGVGAVAVSGRDGYNYASPLTSGSQSSTGTTGSGVVGYNYNTPTSSATTQNSASETISTSAPKYLPPVRGGSGVSVNIPTGGGGGSPVVGGTTPTMTHTTTKVVPVPDTNYLPPLPGSEPSPAPTPVVPSPPSNYLPPSSGQVFPPRQGQVFTPASTYLPPVL